MVSYRMMEEDDVKEREYPRLPMVGVGVLVKKGNDILMVKRIHEPSKDLWSIPGGLVELGETTRDAAKREVFEETGPVRLVVEQNLDGRNAAREFFDKAQGLFGEDVEANDVERVGVREKE